MAVAYQYVTRNTEPPNRLVGSPAIAKKRRRIVGNDYHQIVIAVRAGFSTGGGTKQVDLLRPIQLSKPVDDLGQHWIGGGWRSEPYTLGTDQLYILLSVRLCVLCVLCVSAAK